MEPINFTIEKAYRPNLQLFEEYQEGKPLPPKVEDMRMDSDTEKLAMQHVLARLTLVNVLDWKDWMKAWFGKEGEADIIVMSSVTDGESDKPFGLQLKPFEHVGRRKPLSIDPNFGVMMYQRSGKIPTYLDMRILGRDRQSTRNVGQALSDIRQNSDFKSAVNTLSSAFAGPIGPVFAQVDTLVSLVGAILKLQSDDQLLYYAATVHRDFDRLGIGERNDTTPSWILVIKSRWVEHRILLNFTVGLAGDGRQVLILVG
jgi:hypothetical protein